ncbi:MAG: hypothetical protein HY549_07985 [Elusimicrobia bacterium]|nr:hypothetical protein [Elusimicrobiota bacterium]
MKRTILLSVALLSLGCGHDVAYRPAPQILPSHIRTLSIRLVVNKTQQFGLEDKLALRMRDEFLRDGRYPVVPEANSDGAVSVTISRYILTPIQYDARLIPTAYKLRVMIDLQFIERATNTILWEERNMEASLTYPASTLPGGKTEEQAREVLWDTLARDVVKRVVEGFGSVTGTSERRISSDAPSTPPASAPTAPLPPVNPNPY